MKGNGSVRSQWETELGRGQIFEGKIGEKESFEEERPNVGAPVHPAIILIVVTDYTLIFFAIFVLLLMECAVNRTLQQKYCFVTLIFF
jgi:hypothetical protein